MSEIQLLRIQNKQLKKALKETLWMAAEYAKTSKIFAPYIVNGAIDVALASGVQMKPCYVKDVILGDWNPEIGYFDPINPISTRESSNKK